MLSSHTLKQLQGDQYAHDLRNHSDIWSLHKVDRLKHYGLHFAKYVGRLARGSGEPKPVSRTITDAFLISLSAANTLLQDLSIEAFKAQPSPPLGNSLLVLADATGRFADACEKSDHLEEFVSLAKTANRDIAKWILATADEDHIDLVSRVGARRKELAARLFYIAD
jgi:hypothetical protein